MLQTLVDGSSEAKMLEECNADSQKLLLRDAQVGTKSRPGIGVGTSHAVLWQRTSLGYILNLCERLGLKVMDELIQWKNSPGSQHSDYVWCNCF